VLHGSTVSPHCKNEPALSIEGISGKQLLSLQNLKNGQRERERERESERASERRGREGNEDGRKLTTSIPLCISEFLHSFLAPS
jgi:hypothetical protein